MLCLVLLAAFVSVSSALARSGDLDPSFGEQGRLTAATGERVGGEAAVQVAEGANETIVAGSGKTLFRFLPDGSLDSSFGEGGKLTIAAPEGMPFSLRDLAVDAEGRIVLFGRVENLNAEVPITYMSSIHPYLAAVIRYDSTGRLDSTFGHDGAVVTGFGQPPWRPYDKPLTEVAQGWVRRDGSLVLLADVGAFVPSIGHGYFATFGRLIARLTPSGDFDPSFGGGDGTASETGLADIDDLAPGSGETLLALGLTTKSGYALMRLRHDGTTDVGFGRRGRRPLSLGPPITGLSLDRRGRTIAAAGGSVLRLWPSGKADLKFGYRGRTAVRLPGESRLNSMMVEPSGRILLVGTQSIPKPSAASGSGDYQQSFTVIRLNQSGRPDRAFGHRGWIVTRFGNGSNAAAGEGFIDSQGRLVVGGGVSGANFEPGAIALARYLLH
jgi:uncharacterized delta-60 repeat protein